MKPIRNLKLEEIQLISFLLKDKPEYFAFLQELPDLFVSEMDDGGMGSLEFVAAAAKSKIMRDEIARIDLNDNDGLPLSIAVNTNVFDEVYELDVFKADFSPLKRFPVAPYVFNYYS